ncbi:MAG: hypothetical protein U1E76_13475 [Planctomycetota bacterium]
MRVAIAFNEVEDRDGKSEIDLSQEDVLGAVHAVEEALVGRGHEVMRVPIGHDPIDFLQRLRHSRADVVFNHCEAMLGRSDRELHARWRCSSYRPAGHRLPGVVDRRAARQGDGEEHAVGWGCRRRRAWCCVARTISTCSVDSTIR